MQLFYSATVVAMTPVAQTIVKIYEIAHFLSKTTSFYKKLPPFIKKKNYRSPPEKKLQPLISAFIKNSILQPSKIQTLFYVFGLHFMMYIMYIMYF